MDPQVRQELLECLRNYDSEFTRSPSQAGVNLYDTVIDILARADSSTNTTKINGDVHGPVYSGVFNRPIKL